MKTKGQLEAEISEAMIRFEKEYMGRGPLDARTYLINDMVLVRLKGVLTPAETRLAEDGNAEGREVIKQMRHRLLEHGRPLLENAIRAILGASVVSLHTDISVKTGERVILFTLTNALEHCLEPDPRSPGPRDQTSTRERGGGLKS